MEPNPLLRHTSHLHVTDDTSVRTLLSTCSCLRLCYTYRTACNVVILHTILLL